MKSAAPKSAKKTAKKTTKTTAKKAAQAAPANEEPKAVAQTKGSSQDAKVQKKKKGNNTRKKKDKKAKPMEVTIQADLAVEAHHLRIVLREISGRFISDLESAIVRIVDMVGEVPDNQKQAELKEILKQMQNLRLKPQKGRLGDLRRIRNLVERVNSRLEELI